MIKTLKKLAYIFCLQNIIFWEKVKIVNIAKAVDWEPVRLATSPSSLKLTTWGTIGTLESFIVEIFKNSIFKIAGVIALISIVYGSTLYMTARDDDGQAGKGKQIIITTLTGIIIIFLSYALVKIVLTFGY